MLLNPLLAGISQDQATALTTFFLEHLNALANAGKNCTANGDVESVPVRVEEGDEGKGRKGRSAEDEAELQEAREKAEEGAFKALADDLNKDVLAITNGSTVGSGERPKRQLAPKRSDGRGRSPKREEQ